MPQYQTKTRQMISVTGIHPPVYAGRFYTVAGNVQTLVGKTQNITKASGNTWPATVSPFITVAPAITGTPTSGNVQTCSSGTWLNNAGISYAYAWFRDGITPIGTAVNTYTLVAGDIGHGVTCRVTATNGAGFPATAVSNTVTPASLLRANVEEAVEEEKNNHKSEF